MMTYVSFNEGNRRRFCQRSLSCGHPVRSFVSGEINAAPKQWIPRPAMRGFGGRAADSRRGQRGRAGKERRCSRRRNRLVQVPCRDFNFKLSNSAASTASRPRLGENPARFPAKESASDTLSDALCRNDRYTARDCNAFVNGRI